jgi:hypothetical protein
MAGEMVIGVADGIAGVGGGGWVPGLGAWVWGAEIGKVGSV